MRSRGETVIISKPVNGSDIYETPLSISDSALYFIKVKYGKCKDISKFLMVSDGIYERFYDYEKLQKIMDGELEEFLSCQVEDDATVLIKNMK